MLHGMPRYKPCVAQLHKRQHEEKRYILDRGLTDMGFDLTAPTNWVCGLGKPFNLPIPYLSNKMTGQNVSLSPV